MRTIAPICSLLLLFLPALSQAQNATPAPAHCHAPPRPPARWNISSRRRTGPKVTSPFTVRFGLKGMGVAPAGVTNANTGHHHLLIDTDLPPDNLPIPNDDKHRHFGAGQTEVELTLPPGSTRCSSCSVMRTMFPISRRFTPKRSPSPCKAR